MVYNSPRASHERLVCLKESEIRDIATGNNWEWYLLTIVIYFICAGVGLALAMYLVTMLAKLGASS